MAQLRQSRRGQIGYQYGPQINNDIAVAQLPGRDLLGVQNAIFKNQQVGGQYRALNKLHVTDADIHGMGMQMGMGMGIQTGSGGDISNPDGDYEGDMSGQGIKDIIKSAFEKGKKLATGASNFYSSDTGTFLKNLVPSSDPNARPSYSGEKHAILELPNGKNGVANWMGPGTRVIERVKRGDPGRTPADMVAKRHDIDYVMAADSGNRIDQLSKVREADNRMIASLQKLDASKGDANRNIQMGLRLIQAKKLGEDAGVLSKDAFAGAHSKLNDADKVLLMNERRKLGMEGYGMKQLPGDALRKKVLKQELRKKHKQNYPVLYGSGRPAYKNSRKGLEYPPALVGGNLLIPGVGDGVSRSKTFPGMRAYKMKLGALSGAGFDLGALVETHVMPGLLKSVGLKPGVIPPKLISGVVNAVVDKTKDMPLMRKVSGLANAILPLLTSGKMKALGMPITGSGIRSVTHGAKRNQLRKSLEKGIYRSVKAAMAGRGLSLAGQGSFWEDFKKGFTMVFKPGAKVLGTIATALGQPEIGIPLGIVSEML